MLFASNQTQIFAFLEAVPNLLEESVKEVLRRRVEDQGVWRTDGAAVYASAAEDTFYGKTSSKLMTFLD